MSQAQETGQKPYYLSMEIVYALFGASYLICQMLAAENAFQLWRALPKKGAPVLRWSLMGMSWVGGILGQVVLLATAPLAAPMFIMGRQMVFGLKMTPSSPTYTEARDGWLRFGDPEELWDVAAGVTLDE